MLDKHGHTYLGDSDQSLDLGNQDWTTGPPAADVLQLASSDSVGAIAANRGAPTSTTATGGGGSTSPVTTASPSPFVINIIWDSSVSSAPAGFTAGIFSAVQYLESQFSDPVSINIGVGYGEIGGRSMGGTVGGSTSNLTSVSYSSLQAALTSHSNSATDASVLASLPATSPVNGTYWTTDAQAKALGLVASGGTSLDGYVGFSSTLPFTYGNTNDVATGTYDFTNVALHEITEVMGRQILAGGTIGSTANSYDLLDLLHYSAPGTRDFSASTPGYFSVDGGTTNLRAFNTVPGGDPGDWASSAANDAFDAFTHSGTVTVVSSVDLTEMNAIGWNPAIASEPTDGPSSTPTVVSASAGTASLPALQRTSGGDVIVGGSGSEIISPSTLTGTLASGTPTFVLAGAGNINATGKTGEVVLDGGAGTDVMTGGSGLNMLDLTGLGTALSYAGQDTTSRLTAHSVGWQVSSGNMFVYVNTTGASESLSATNMEIEPFARVFGRA
jgi:hypothetical protein